MPTSISLAGIQAMMAVQTNRIFTHLIEFKYQTNSLCFIANNEDLIFDSKTWTAKAFEATLPAEKDNSLPVMTISFDNVESFDIISLLRSVTGGITAKYGIIAFSNSSDPVLEKGWLNFEVTQVKYDEKILTVYLSYEKDYLNDPAVKDSFNPALFCGLFS